MSSVRCQRLSCMLFVVIALIGLAGCSSGADDSANNPAPTEVSQVSGEDGVAPTERIETPAPPPGATQGAAPTERAEAAVPTPATTPDFSLAPGTSSFDADGDGFMTAAELRAATNATMPEFRFPPEHQVTGDQIADQMLGSNPPSDPASESYQIKMEYTLIGGHHRCAWERVYLEANASGDTARRQQALDALLAALPKRPMGDDSRAFIEDYYRKAQLGDPSGVARDVEVNCNGIGLLTPVSGT